MPFGTPENMNRKMRIITDRTVLNGTFIEEFPEDEIPITDWSESSNRRGQFIQE
jgi:hypothetical protein